LGTIPVGTLASTAGAEVFQQGKGHFITARKRGSFSNPEAASTAGACGGLVSAAGYVHKPSASSMVHAAITAAPTVEDGRNTEFHLKSNECESSFHTLSQPPTKFLKLGTGFKERRNIDLKLVDHSSNSDDSSCYFSSSSRVADQRKVHAVAKNHPFDHRYSTINLSYDDAIGECDDDSDASTADEDILSYLTTDTDVDFTKHVAPQRPSVPDHQHEPGFLNDELPDRPLLVTAFQLPRTGTVQTPPYCYTRHTAPNRFRDSAITYENMGKHHEISLQDEPFVSKGITSFFSFVKLGKGIMWQNRSSVKLHYETTIDNMTNKVGAQAKCKAVNHYIFDQVRNRRQCIRDGDNIIIYESVPTEETVFKDFHASVDFRELIRGACITGKNEIRSVDTVRYNSGVSVGLSSNRGTLRCKGKAHAEPLLSKGTHRFGNVFGIISSITFKLLQSHGLLKQGSPFNKLFERMERMSPKQQHYAKKCQEINQDKNVYLSLSFKIYLHHADNMTNHNGHFKAHRDENNPEHESINDIMFTGWDTWFEPTLGCFVTGTLIACGRKSQEDLYNRSSQLNSICSELLDRQYASLTTQQKILLPELIFSHILTPVHYIKRYVLLFTLRYLYSYVQCQMLTHNS